MKRKNQNKCYRARAVTLITYVNNQLVCATNYCLINSVIDALMTLLRKTFVLSVFKTEKLWKIQCEDLQLYYFTKHGRNRPFVNLAIGIGIDITSDIISSSIRPMDPFAAWGLGMEETHPQSHVTHQPSGHVMNQRRYISTFTSPMDPKLSRVVT